MNLAPKIQNSRMSEQEYRKLKTHLNYSSIKLFDNDREAFYRQCVLGEQPKEKSSNALVMGQLCHTLLANIENEFDNKFHIASAKVPKPQMLKLCENLYARSLQSMNEFNEQQDSFKIIFSDAVNRTKYNFNQEEVEFKGKDEKKILEMFDGSDAEMYFKEMLECVGKTIVTVPQIEQAEKLVSKVKESNVTGKIVNQQNEWFDEVRKIKAVEVWNELPIIFEIDGVQCRSMPDKIIVNHLSRKISMYDYKCSWQTSDTIENVYLKLGYYIQAAMYDMSLQSWSKEHGLGDYQIEGMQFIFLDTSAFNDPFILKVSRDDIERATRGFKVRSYRYKGLAELMHEIAHHLETGNWKQSYTEYKNSGIIPLQLPYGSR